MTERMAKCQVRLPCNHEEKRWISAYRPNTTFGHVAMSAEVGCRPRGGRVHLHLMIKDSVNRMPRQVLLTARGCLKMLSPSAREKVNGYEID